MSLAKTEDIKDIVIKRKVPRHIETIESVLRGVVFNIEEGEQVDESWLKDSLELAGYSIVNSSEVNTLQSQLDLERKKVELLEECRKFYEDRNNYTFTCMTPLGNDSGADFIHEIGGEFARQTGEKIKEMR